MSGHKNKTSGYQPLSSSSKSRDGKGQPSGTFSDFTKQEKTGVQSFKNKGRNFSQEEPFVEIRSSKDEPPKSAAPVPESEEESTLSYSEKIKLDKERNIAEKDEYLLSRDNWKARTGHTFTYIGIFLFTLVIYFRPYELIDIFSSFTSIALYIAVATLIIYVAAQLKIENNFTTLTTEVKCMLVLVACAVLTLPIAISPATAWTKFSEDFSKVAVIFLIMVNTIRTKSRLQGLMWLGIAAGVMLSYQAINFYNEGVFKTEGYRVSVELGGMFGNPNDLATHFVIFIPIALTLALVSKYKLAKILYFVAVGMMVVGIMVTQSRGGFLALLGMGAVLAWKIGRSQRLKVALFSIIGGLFFVAIAPGNYALRIMSIFVPSMDPAGSSNERMELFLQSILVTLRNPLGIGMGNFPIVGIRNRETHNAFTQVSSELGIIAFIAYVILLISPWRKLNAIERRMYLQKDFSYVYYLSIGVQASIVAYVISSFFGPYAYTWFVYYPLVYAICLRRIYHMSQTETEKTVQDAGFESHHKS
jgi:hypothetical protein